MAQFLIDFVDSKGTFITSEYFGDGTHEAAASTGRAKLTSATRRNPNIVAAVGYERTSINDRASKVAALSSP